MVVIKKFPPVGNNTILYELMVYRTSSYTCTLYTSSYTEDGKSKHDFVFISAADITASNYWRLPFKSLGTYKQLTEFMVLQIEPVESQKPSASICNLSQKVFI